MYVTTVNNREVILTVGSMYVNSNRMGIKKQADKFKKRKEKDEEFWQTLV